MFFCFALFVGNDVGGVVLAVSGLFGDCLLCFFVLAFMYMIACGSCFFLCVFI